VEEAASGPEAIAKAQACGGSYDVAIIDQVMGPPNGTDTMLRLHEFYPHIQIIILTGWGDMEPGERALRMGAYRYMSKPISNADELVLNIRTAATLGRERQRSHALQALLRAGERISSVQDEQELYQQLYEEAAELLPGLDSFLISCHDEQNELLDFTWCYLRGEVSEMDRRKSGNGLTEYVLRHRRPLLLPDGDTAFREKHDLDPPDPGLGYCTSEIVVPMFLEGGVLGAINAITHQAGVRYSREHMEVLQALANQAAAAIQKVQQLEEARQLLDAATALASQQGKAAVLRAIVTEAHALIGHDYTSLILQDKDGTLRRAHPVMPEEYRDLFEEPRQQGGLTRLVVTTREPLIIPDASQDLRVAKNAREKGIRSVLAMPLIYEDRVLGVLYTHTFEPWYFGHHEVNLWRVFAVQAAAALYSASEEERELERLSERLRAMIELFQAYRERRNGSWILKRIAEAAKTTLSMDACSLLEYDPDTEDFSERGTAGLNVPDAPYTPFPGFKSRFLDESKPTIVCDTRLDKSLCRSEFVRRENVQSVIVYPLRLEGELLGLLFANYRTRREPTPDELEAIGLFASLAALVVYEARLQEQLSRTEKRLQRRMLLDRVSTIEATYRHAQVGKAAAICNYTAVLQRRLAAHTSLPEAMSDVQGIIADIDRLAKGIASTPPRAPQSWESESELIPLASLLWEIAEREGKPSPLRSGPRIEIRADVAALGGIQVRASRRWLVYALEALLQNARTAMPQGGAITLSGRCAGQWAEVRVRDTGMGVPESIQHLLFRDEIPKAEYQAGMGIGALLVGTIVEECGGSVGIEKPGPGDTTVLVRLPIAQEV
jgi:GAF domain-containing protein